ncbi:MAG: hypothetical protein A2Z25_03015 [Planctomycetes bacterium RBG_16_55_9]|nr:MAG: hypothetical protein A2Z25_03015 [Planctomycetes bacterium RBG_16_55_9]
MAVAISWLQAFGIAAIAEFTLSVVEGLLRNDGETIGWVPSGGWQPHPDCRLSAAGGLIGMGMAGPERIR